MEYRSERLMYREFTKDDFRLFYSIFSNDKVMKYALMDQCQGEEDILPYFKEVLANNLATENRSTYEFAVFSILEGCFIGFADIEIHVQNSFGGCGEIGYFITPEHWGMGYATEVANSLIQISFKHINLHRVSARCNSNNLRSENVMKKVGMFKEGESRKVRYKNNLWENEQHYSILIEEWKNKKNVQEISNESLDNIV